MPIFTTENVNQTEALGARLGSVVPAGEVVALFGELGAGKTAFVRGVASGMGISADVSSPTFAIVNEYRAGDKILYHFDMYRVISWESLYSTGFFDYLDSGAVLIIEWSENIESVLPENCLKVTITKTDDTNQRIIEMQGSEWLDAVSWD